MKRDPTKSEVVFRDPNGVHPSASDVPAWLQPIRYIRKAIEGVGRGLNDRGSEYRKGEVRSRFQLEPLEDRLLLSADPVGGAVLVPESTETATVLTFNAASNGRADSYTLRLNAGTGDLELLNETTVVAAQALANTRAVVIVGEDGQDDNLTIDLGFGGMFSLAEGIKFNGGVDGIDALSVVGGTFTSATHTATTDGPGLSGVMVYQDGIHQDLVIEYTDLEPIDMSGSNIANLVFNLPDDRSNFAFLEDDGIIGNNRSQLRSGDGGFETTFFSGDVNSVTINLGDQADAINIGTLRDFNRSLFIRDTQGRGDVAFLGTTNLSSLSVDVTGTISDFPGANLSVSGHADLKTSLQGSFSLPVTAIALGDNLAAERVDFGSLSFNSFEHVLIHESGATVLLLSSTADSLELSSQAVTSGGLFNLVVAGDADIFSGTSIFLANGFQDSMHIGGDLFLRAFGIVAIGESGTTSFRTVEVDATGQISINEDSSTVVMGARSTAGSISISSENDLVLVEQVVTTTNLSLRSVNGGISSLAPVFAQAVSLDAREGITLTDADNSIASINARSSNGGVSVIDGSGDLTAIVSAANGVSIVSAGTTILGSLVISPGKTVSITADRIAGFGAIVANRAELQTRNGMTISTVDVSEVSAVNSGNNGIDLNFIRDVSLSAVRNTAGPVVLRSSGSIFGGPNSISASSATISTASGITLLGGTIGSLQATNTASGNVSITGMTGPMNVAAGGVINQAAGGNVTLATSGNLTLTGDVTVRDGGTVSLTGQTIIETGGTTNAGALNLVSAMGTRLIDLVATRLSSVNTGVGNTTLSMTGPVAIVGAGLVNTGGNVDLTAAGDIELNAGVTVTGTVGLNSSGEIKTLSGSFNANTALLNATQGISLVANSIANLRAMSLGGDISIKGLPGAVHVNGVTTGGGNIVLESAGNLHLTGSIHAGFGTIDLGAGGSIVQAGGAVFASVLRVKSNGANLSTDVGVLEAIQTNGNLVVRNARDLALLDILVNGDVAIEANGQLRILGTLDAGTNAIALGASNGVVFESTAMLEVDLAGTDAPDFTHVLISGHVALGGVLNASLESGFIPVPGDHFRFMEFDSREGDFLADHLPENLVVDSSHPQYLELAFLNPDNVSPTVTIDQAPGQSDPTNGDAIEFAVLFSEEVVGFTAEDIRLDASDFDDLVVTVTGSGASYSVFVMGMEGRGNVIASIEAGAAADLAGNASIASTSTDNSVGFDNVGPAVTVNQASGQIDPTNGDIIRFEVIFSESIVGFDADDILFDGSTVGGSLSASITGSGAAYTVAVTGMEGRGAVVVSLGAGAALDLAGNESDASTSLDNAVVFDNIKPTVTIDQAAGQADPVGVGPILFSVQFSEAVSGFDAADISFAGSTVGGTLVALVTGSQDRYTVQVTGMQGSGVAVASIVAGAALDSAGNSSSGSTSTDNQVTIVQHVPTPDLVGTVNWSPANPLIPGDDEDVTVVVRNAGDAKANGRTQVKLYASTDNVLDAGDMLLATGQTAGSIAAGASSSVRLDVDFSSNLRPGSYALLAVVDSANQVNESNEANNVAIGKGFEFAWMFGDVPHHGHESLTVRDADGTLVNFSLLGPGLGKVALGAEGDWALSVTGSSDKSLLSVLTLGGGNNRVALDGVHIKGSIGGLIAPTMDLTGTLAVGKAVTAGLILGSATNAVLAVPKIVGTQLAGVSIQGIAVLGDVRNSHILIGADLGQDGKLGGTGVNVDSFAGGHLGDLVIGGSMIGSSVRVGQDPRDGIFDNGNDVLRSGSIRSISIHDRMSSDSRFVAQDLPAFARIGEHRIKTATDSRFLESLSTGVSARAMHADIDWSGESMGLFGSAPITTPFKSDLVSDFVRT